ncbi:D-arabinono-1,4-lactone oxidase [Kurthia massiliensis]|uniref:D-arabinono-1,4-lactone oxidase n=1 Tax=Kurthia massiliensis TaxID=1033739 RepID=UPI00028A3DCB|nr:D-arabinono-1,4-lactone oxidase [Kurthia massiliensis]
MFSIEGNWSNWANTYTAKHIQHYQPTTIDEVSDIVKHARQTKQTVRTSGARHSFSGVAQPDQLSINLHEMRGLIHVDEMQQQATFWAGTYLCEIGPLLAPYQLALENMGDIDVQSLAGAVSTGTHGTGVTLGSISNQVVRWGIIDGEGQYREVFRDDPLADALHISLGLFGVLVDITIQAVPIYGLHGRSSRITVKQTLAQFRSIVATHRHAEWFYFPGQEQMQLKVMDAVPYEQITLKQPKRLDALLENQALQLVSTMCRIAPKMTPFVSALSAKAVPIGEQQDVSYRVFATPRNVKFMECEYAMPIQYFESFLEEFHIVMQRQLFDVHFPIECRTQKGERGILSPTQGQDSVWIAFHMYRGMPYKRYFRFIDELLKKYGARAHFGKMNLYTRHELVTLYNELDIFLARRREFDKYGVFMSKYAKNIFE